jgi:hypothetical protein
MSRSGKNQTAKKNVHFWVTIPFHEKLRCRLFPLQAVGHALGSNRTKASGWTFTQILLISITHSQYVRTLI